MNRTNVFNFSKITCANINCQPLSIADTWEISTKNLSLPKSYVTCTWIKNQTAQPNTMNNKRNFMQLYSLGWISSGWLEGRKLFLLFLPSATWLQTTLSLLNHAILTPSSGQGHVLHYFSSQCTRAHLQSWQNNGILLEICDTQTQKFMNFFFYLSDFSMTSQNT